MAIDRIQIHTIYGSRRIVLDSRVRTGLIICVALIDRNAVPPGDRPAWQLLRFRRRPVIVPIDKNYL